MVDVMQPYNELTPISELYIRPTEEILQLVEKTRVALALLDYVVGKLPSSNILLDNIALQEAKSSSKIENIVTTNDELYSGLALQEVTGAVKEVVDYKEALFTGFQELRRKGLIALSDIENINKVVNKKEPGVRHNMAEFAETLTRIANIKEDGSSEVLYTPPHGKELLFKLLVDLLEFIYDDERYNLHPLIKIALAHYQFESIHPFYDGNGRTGRILNILFLCQKEYLRQPVLYASAYIIKNKDEYYRLLRETHQHEDYNKVIAYMLTSFHNTAHETLQKVEAIDSLYKHYVSQEFLGKLPGNKTVMEQVVTLAFEKVYLRISDLVDAGIHRQTASAHLHNLVESGLLTVETVKREKLFKNMELLKLFGGKNNEDKH